MAPKLTAPVPGLLDGNGRGARLARWLRNKPTHDAIDQLVLEVRDEGEWSRLQCWPAAAVGMELAPIIDGMVQDLANEVGAYVHARVAWFDVDKDRAWTEHALRVQPDGMGGQQAFSGDANSIAIQNQRALERLQGLYMGGMESSLRAATQSADLSAETARQAQAEVLALRERVTELEAENSQLRIDCESAVQAAEQLAAEADKAAGSNSPANQVLSLLAPALMNMGKPTPAS